MKSAPARSAALSSRTARVGSRESAVGVRPSGCALRPGCRAAGLLLTVLAIGSMGADYHSPNFAVTAPTEEIAREIAIRAEEYRRDLALEWVGRELPRWRVPCTVTVQIKDRGASGATSFVFDRGRVSDWDMTVSGTLDRILDTVLPHEISHTILASDLGRPVPRWADEGAAQLAENEAERNRQHLLVAQWLQSGRRMPLRTLLSLSQYPASGDEVTALYAQGFSLTEFLVEPGGRSRYLAFLRTSQRTTWDRALARHYGFRNVEELEDHWQRWVLDGRPELMIPEGGLLVDARPVVPAGEAIARADRTAPAEPAVVPASGAE